MIAWLEGTLREKAPARAVVVAGGVGYEAWIPLSTFMELPDEGKIVALHVHTHVREDAIQLYGFASALERRVFELLIKTSGVGPKLALAILSGLEPLRLLEALRTGAVSTLRSVPGVGPKMAERIAVELRDRAAEIMAAQGASNAPRGAASARAASSADMQEEAISALVNLGHPRAQAQRLVEAAAAEVGSDASLELCLRAALRRSSR
jgi:Holliday junction DNA helicase RuvA